MIKSIHRTDTIRHKSPFSRSILLSYLALQSPGPAVKFRHFYEILMRSCNQRLKLLCGVWRFLRWSSATLPLVFRRKLELANYIQLNTFENVSVKLLMIHRWWLKCTLVILIRLVFNGISTIKLEYIGLGRVGGGGWFRNPNKMTPNDIVKNTMRLITKWSAQIYILRAQKKELSPFLDLTQSLLLPLVPTVVNLTGI